MHRSTILSWPAGRLARAALAAAGLALAVAVAAPAAASAAPAPTLIWARGPGAPPLTSFDFSCGGCAGDSLAFVVRNSSQSATSALTITVTGSPAFTKVADTCTGISLSPGAYCFVDIGFLPAAPIIFGHQYKGLATASLHGSEDGTTMTLTGTISPAP